MVRKGEIACNKQFLLFSQCLLPYMVLIFNFKCRLKCCLQFVSIWTSLKCCRLVMSERCLYIPRLTLTNQSPSKLDHSKTEIKLLEKNRTDIDTGEFYFPLSFLVYVYKLFFPPTKSQNQSPITTGSISRRQFRFS